MATNLAIASSPVPEDPMEEIYYDVQTLVELKVPITLEQATEYQSRVLQAIDPHAENMMTGYADFKKDQVGPMLEAAGLSWDDFDTKYDELRMREVVPKRLADRVRWQANALVRAAKENW